jgi:rRNA small subunit pseudouridine methyltransferase Nep1
MVPHVIILEEASLELVPKKYWSQESCKLYEARFGIPPGSQILDDNFHHDIVQKLHGKEKRGRPDIVHFALLDIVSTPAYFENLVRPVIHTRNDEVIVIKEGVHLPRTLPRFNGVMSKILQGEAGGKELDLFEFRQVQNTEDLIRSLGTRGVCCLTSQGIHRDLDKFVYEKSGSAGKGVQVWIVGGFARGHFKEHVKGLATDLVSISDHSLAAHVVTARLSFEIELAAPNARRA